MAYTFENVLDYELVTVVTRDDSRGVFEIRVGELETIVTIELRRDMSRNDTEFRLSHAIKTPLQIGPYRTSCPIGGDPAYALNLAVTGLINHYREAVDDGHSPSEDWLVEN